MNDSADDNRQQVEDRIRANLSDQGAEDGEIDCTVEGAIDSISEEEFEAPEPPDDLAERVEEAAADCVDDEPTESDSE